MIDLKTGIHKISVGPKLLQLKICVRNNQKNRAPEEFSSIFSEITKRCVLQLTGDMIVILDELKRPVVDALHFRHRGSTKILADINIFWSPGMKKTSKTDAARAPHA